jgi:hypothetical protein
MNIVLQMVSITELSFSHGCDDELTIMALEPWRAKHSCRGVRCKDICAWSSGIELSSTLGSGVERETGEGRSIKGKAPRAAIAKRDHVAYRIECTQKSTDF